MTKNWKNLTAEKKFNIFLIIFALLDPDPKSENESGSTVIFGSGSATLSRSGYFVIAHIFYFTSRIATDWFVLSELLEPVLRIRIRIYQIHMFLGLLDPDPLVRGMDPDPDPSITKQK